MASSDGRPAKSSEELRSIYADAAPKFDRMLPLDRLLVGGYRESAFGDLRGEVLEVACGAGENLDAIPRSADLVGVDLSPDMLVRARRRASDEGRSVSFVRGDAGSLPFADDRFDGVCSSMSTCTFPDPIAALREMARVCRPDGTIRLLEHGRSYLTPVARLQDRFAGHHFESMGCRWNQQPLSLVRRAGLRVERADRYLGGVLTVVAARPPRSEDDPS